MLFTPKELRESAIAHCTTGIHRPMTGEKSTDVVEEGESVSS